MRRTSAIFLLLALSACGDSSGPKPTVIWEGTVTSSATGAPIAGASVAVGDGSGLFVAVEVSGTTDAQGHFSLSRSGCMRTPWVVASAPGYGSHDRAIGCRAGTQTVDITLTPVP